MKVDCRVAARRTDDDRTGRPPAPHGGPACCGGQADTLGSGKCRCVRTNRTERATALTGGPRARLTMNGIRRATPSIRLARPSLDPHHWERREDGSTRGGAGGRAIVSGAGGRGSRPPPKPQRVRRRRWPVWPRHEVAEVEIEEHRSGAQRHQRVGLCCLARGTKAGSPSLAMGVSTKSMRPRRAPHRNVR